MQIGITVIAVLSGTFGEATLGDRLERELRAYSGFVAQYAHVISMAVVVIGISYLSLIIGELVPKRVALVHPERIAAALARLMREARPRRRADRMVLERLDRFRAAPAAHPRRWVGAGDRRRDHLHAA